MHRFPIALLPTALWIALVPGQAEQIFKTVGEDGRVLFTNDPANADQAEVIVMPAPPDQRQVEAALEREERIREIGDKMQRDRSQREAQQAKIAAQQRKELAEAERDRQLMEKLDQMSRPRAYFSPPYYRPWPKWPPGGHPGARPQPPVASPQPSLKPRPN